MTVTLIEGLGIAKHQRDAAHHGEPILPLELAMVSALAAAGRQFRVTQIRSNVFRLNIDAYQSVKLWGRPPYTEIRVTTDEYRIADRVELARLTTPAEVYEWVESLGG